MNSKLWSKFILLLVVAIAAAGFKCSGGIQKQSWNDELSKTLGGATMGIPKTNFEPRPYKYTSAQGAIVESVAPVPQIALDSLDRAFQRRIGRFGIMFPNWTDARVVRGTRVIFVEPNRTYSPEGTPSAPCRLESIPGAPCIFVHGIKSAGTVAGTNVRWDLLDLDPPLILPHQADGNWQWLDYLEAAAHNEDEHRAGWLNLRNDPTGVFYRFLGVNDNHPWQWGDNVPLHRESNGVPDEANHCFPIVTPEELKKIAAELGVSVKDLDVPSSLITR